MKGQREVVANPRNMVLFRGFFEQGIGGCAVRALLVFEFENGYARARWRLERGRIVDLRGGWRAELRMSAGCGEKKDGAQKAKENAGGVAVIPAKEGEKATHSGWTAPYPHCNGRDTGKLPRRRC
jgi:hypothetical protein